MESPFPIRLERPETMWRSLALRRAAVGLAGVALLVVAGNVLGVEPLAAGGPLAELLVKVRRPGLRIVSPFAEGLAAFRDQKAQRMGYLDGRGAVVIPARFRAAGRFAAGLAPVQEEGRAGWGFIDRSGRWVIPPRFDAALAFAEGLAPVRRGGAWGFVDRTGRLVIPPRFDAVEAFSEGRAGAVVEGRVGFIDRSGAWVVPAVHFRAGPFRQGLAYVCGRRRCGFIDPRGRQVIAPRFDDAGSFASDRAPVRLGPRWGYIDRSGRLVIPAIFDEAAPFSGGLARVAEIRNGSFDPTFGGYTGRAPFYGFIDPTGRAVVATRMLGATPFSDGFTVASLPAGSLCSDCRDVRLMDPAGRFLPGRFDSASPMQDGLAVVDRWDRSYVIDRRGWPLVSLDRSSPQASDQAARRIVALRHGYVDAAGATVIPFRYLEAQPFSEGLAFVAGPWWTQGGRLRGFLDRSGTLKLPLDRAISQVLPFREGRALFSLFSRRKDGSQAWGFLDRKGSEAIPARYADAASFSEGLAAVKVSGDLGAPDWGYIDRRGRPVISPRYGAAGPFVNGLAYVERLGEPQFGGRLVLSEVIDRRARVVVARPFLPWSSRLLIGGSYLEQEHPRRQLVFGEGLVPTLDGAFRGWTGPAGRRVVPELAVADFGLFSEGRAPVARACGAGCEDPWGFVDPSGKVVVTPRFRQVQRYSEGLAAVQDIAGRWGYITPSGGLAIEPMWLEEAHPFAGGLARVRLNGFWGYLDRRGNFAIPPRYLRAEDFSEGLAATAVAAPTKERR
jgi:hypothetical protein